MQTHLGYNVNNNYCNASRVESWRAEMDHLDNISQTITPSTSEIQDAVPESVRLTRVYICAIKGRKVLLIIVHCLCNILALHNTGRVDRE